MSQFRFLIFDPSIEYIEEYRKQLLPNENVSFDFALGGIEIATANSSEASASAVDIVVSGGDSCGLSFDLPDSLDGTYCEVFPDIQSRVQFRIRRCCQTESQRGIRALPIGSALLVSTGNQSTKLLAFVPTMMVPCSIEDTFNVYWAMRGLLRLLDDTTTVGGRPITVAMPCLGCDIGGLTPQTSAEQIAVAIDDHLRGNYSVCDPECNVEVLTPPGKWAYILSGHAPAPPTPPN